MLIWESVDERCDTMSMLSSSSGIEEICFCMGRCADTAAVDKREKLVPTNRGMVLAGLFDSRMRRRGVDWACMPRMFPMRGMARRADFTGGATSGTHNTEGSKS